MHNPRVRHTRSRTARSEGSSVFRVSSLKDVMRNSSGKNIWIRVIGALFLLFLLGIFLIWALFLRDLPSIDKLETGGYFRESTVIYDKDNNEIYRLLKDGNRTYVNYDAISQSIKDAIVSIEDKTFFENPGIDFMGLMRVGVSYVTGGKIGGRIGGASTISQQLIKNTLLTNEVSLKRKVQEAVLSYQMNKKYSKEKILEMYLNAFSFGYNANGVEQASQTYFGKSAKDVGPLGATILASLPQGPTKYSPYDNRDRLMGKLEVYPNESPTSKKMLISADDRKNYAPLYTAFKTYLSGMTMERQNSGLRICGVNPNNIKDREFSPDGQGCLNIRFDEVTPFIGSMAVSKSINIADGSGSHMGNYTIEYTVGRKDMVASRMLEDGKIDGETLKKIVYDGLEFEFKKYTEKIKYPYFVIPVKKYLEDKYGKDIEVTSGLKVYTTLDPKLQEYAEEAVRKQVAINKSQYGASSAALVSMDNTNGRILAIVGGPDYFDTENGGNNNMITDARVQPGSSFKPIVYALALSRNPIGPASPVADVETKFGKYAPNNYDGRYNGMMTVETALDYSRNIPAIKMYYLAGQEDAIVKHGKTLGLASMKENASYGAQLGIGGVEVKPIEMLQAYSILANNGIKRNAHFISRIEDSEGNKIEENKDEKGEEVFSPAASYIISTILSNEDARPASSFWRNALSIPGRKVAAKTGTSNKPAKNHGSILPANLWTIGYTPQITTVVWAGNVDGSATKGSCDGLNCAAPIWKSFMTFALKDLPKEDFKKPDGVYEYTVSKLTGLLAGKNTPDEMSRKTMMAVKFDQYDDGVETTEIDSLCGGPVTSETPADARVKLYRPTGKPIIDGYDPDWYSGFLGASKMSAAIATGSGNLNSTEPCFRPTAAGSVNLDVHLEGQNLSVSWDGNRLIDKVIALQNGKIIKTIEFGSGAKNKDTILIEIGAGVENTIAQIVDVYGYRYSAGTTTGQAPTLPNTDLPPTDTTATNTAANPPVISISNPRGGSINLREGDIFNLRFQIQVSTKIREIDVSIDGKTIQSATSGDIFVFPVSTLGLGEGKHTVTITVKDANLKQAVKNFTLNIIP